MSVQRGKVFFAVRIPLYQVKLIDQVAANPFSITFPGNFHGISWASQYIVVYINRLVEQPGCIAAGFCLFFTSQEPGAQAPFFSIPLSIFAFFRLAFDYYKLFC